MVVKSLKTLIITSQVVLFAVLVSLWLWTQVPRTTFEAIAGAASLSDPSLRIRAAIARVNGYDNACSSLQVSEGRQLRVSVSKKLGGVVAPIGKQIGSGLLILVLNYPRTDYRADHEDIHLGLRSFRINRTASTTQSGEVFYSYRFQIHLLALAIVFSVDPAWLLARTLRRITWARSGRCTGCGYDLRGSASTICSECGRQTAP